MMQAIGHNLQLVLLAVLLLTAIAATANFIVQRRMIRAYEEAIRLRDELIAAMAWQLWEYEHGDDEPPAFTRPRPRARRTDA